MLYGIFHCSLSMVPVQYESGMPMYEYFLLVIVQTFIYTWVINNTRSQNGQPNMFLAIIIHQIGNYTSAVLPFYITGTGRWILFGLNLIFVVCIILIFGYKTLGPRIKRIRIEK